MPLVMMCGGPSSGKTTLARELAAKLSAPSPDTPAEAEPLHAPTSMDVRVVSEHDLPYEKNAVYGSAALEKEQRSALRSEVQRWLTAERVVVLDAPNYIKGFRYELYCAAKAVHARHCVVWAGVRLDVARKWNSARVTAAATEDVVARDSLNTATDDLTVRGEAGSCGNATHASGRTTNGSGHGSISIGEHARSWTPAGDADTPYMDDVFDAVWARFEDPSSSARWDAPLFVVQPGTAGLELPVGDIRAALTRGAAPKPNMSTQNLQPATSGNFLHRLDGVTQRVVADVLDAQRAGCLPGAVTVRGTDVKLRAGAELTAAELRRLKRQFVTYTKRRPIASTDNLETLFVLYLNERVS